MLMTKLAIDRSRFCWLDGVALAALGCYALAVLPLFPTVVAQVAATVLCFVLTGVALAAAVLRRQVGATAFFTCVVACVVSAGMVGGVLLDHLSSGLVAFNWATYALAVTLVAYAVARVCGAGRIVRLPRIVVPSWTAGVKVGAAMLLLAAAVAFSLTSHNREPAFTEFWLIPDNPTQLPAGATSAAVGVRSHETGPRTFTVVSKTGRQTITDRITLAPGESWSRTVPVEGRKAVASIYVGEPAGEPYRTVWIDSQR